MERSLDSIAEPKEDWHGLKWNKIYEMNSKRNVISPVHQMRKRADQSLYKFCHLNFQFITYARLILIRHKSPFCKFHRRRSRSTAAINSLMDLVQRQRLVSSYPFDGQNMPIMSIIRVSNECYSNTNYGNAINSSATRAAGWGEAESPWLGK